MLRILTITFFIGLILFKPISQFSWEVWYQVNKTYVATELCENIAQLELRCNGQCYLMKQLKKAEIQKQTEQDKHQPNPFASKSVVNWVDTPLVFFLPEHSMKLNLSHAFHYAMTRSTNATIDIFHPPQLLS